MSETLARRYRAALRDEVHLSIVVCTRNRAKHIGACLNAITATVEAAKVEGVHSEVVVVDNGSEDHTGMVLSAWAKDQSFPVTLCYEPIKGVSYARNVGLSLTQGNLICLTDDDCRYAEDFAEQAARIFAADRGPVIRGGRVELGDPADYPITVKTDPDPACYTLKEQLGGFIHGANLLFNRAVFHRLGPYDARFGPGGMFPAADETDYMLRAINVGIPVLYEPRLTTYHFHGRRDAGDVRRLMAGYFYSDGAMFAKHLPWSGAARYLFARNVKYGLVNLFVRRYSGKIFKRMDLFKVWHNLRGVLAFFQHGTSYKHPSQGLVRIEDVDKLPT